MDRYTGGLIKIHWKAYLPAILFTGQWQLRLVLL